MSVCRGESVSIRERRRDHKIPFIVFVFVLKFQAVSVLYGIHHFIKLEDKIIVLCQPCILGLFH